jgi:hypothetical protein
VQSLVFYSFRACINQTLSLSPRRTLSYWKAARYEELLRAHKQTNGVKARTWHRVEARAVLRAACGLLWRSANGDGAQHDADDLEFREKNHFGVRTDRQSHAMHKNTDCTQPVCVRGKNSLWSYRLLSGPCSDSLRHTCFVILGKPRTCFSFSLRNSSWFVAMSPNQA